MKTGWLIYKKEDASKNESYIDWFIKEANKQNINLQLIYRENLLIGINGITFLTYYKNKVINLPDFCIIRTLDATLQAHFSALNILCFNNYETSLICNDKSATHIEVAKIGVTAVETFHFDGKELHEPPIPFPFILKSVNGRSGSEVFLIENKNKLSHVLNNKITSRFIIQSANVQMGKDLRVFVIGKKIIAAVLRESKNDFRANYKLGGSATLYHLNNDDIALIKTIVNHFDFGLVGIDFLIGHNSQLLFNEIEDVVGSRILSETTDINILSEYLTYIRSYL